jgi:hypothetical protein
MNEIIKFTYLSSSNDQTKTSNVSDLDIPKLNSVDVDYGTGNRNKCNQTIVTEEELKQLEDNIPFNILLNSMEDYVAENGIEVTSRLTLKASLSYTEGSHNPVLSNHGSLDLIRTLNYSDTISLLNRITLPEDQKIEMINSFTALEESSSNLNLDNLSLIETNNRLLAEFGLITPIVQIYQNENGAYFIGFGQFQAEKVVALDTLMELFPKITGVEVKLFYTPIDLETKEFPIVVFNLNE